MKQPKKLTRAQKIFLTKHGKDPKDYALDQELRNVIIFLNKRTGVLEAFDK